MVSGGGGIGPGEEVDFLDGGDYGICGSRLPRKRFFLCNPYFFFEIRVTGFDTSHFSLEAI